MLESFGYRGDKKIVFGCELIAQRTFLPQGDSGAGSVCDDKRHGNGIENDCRVGGYDSGGQSRRIRSDSDSNGGSDVFKDFNGFKDNRGFAGICNSESVSDCNGDVWDCVNAVKGMANGGSNSGGVGDIDSGSGVVDDSNGVEAGGSDETRDAAGEAVGEGIVFGSSNDADNGDAYDDADHGEAFDDADDGDEFDDAEGGFDGNEYVGAGKDSVDGSGASESTRNHTVEGVNLMMQLKAWEIKEMRMRIWRMTIYVKQLKKVNYGIVVGLKAAKVSSHGCGRQKVMCEEISQQ